MRITEYGSTFVINVLPALHAIYGSMWRGQAARKKGDIARKRGPTAVEIELIEVT
jgi:hypothetical protein